MNPGTLEHLERLEAEWKSLQPLEALREEKIWQKLRLEWNFHSNHIEGNTLTYGETAALLLHDQTSGQHSLREYAEMKGHDFAIGLVCKLASSSEELTQADIRGLNEIILKEPFYKEAITPDGASTRKLITPGRYKEEPNSVRTVTGALHEYASPMDVPSRMAQLIEAVRKGTEKSGLEFMATLAITHREFTAIHPFDDGNGRVARLITNYLLLKKGLLPLRIPSERKADYLAALRLADEGDPALLTDFFAEQLVWSLELGIKAAKGESLEEPSDIEKEIVLFVREQKSQKKEVLKKNSHVVYDALVTTVKLLFEKVEAKTQNIGELFESRTSFFSSDTFSWATAWVDQLNSLKAGDISRPPSQVGLNISLKGYIGKSQHPFGIDQAIVVHLQDYEYRIEIYGVPVHHAIYSEPLTPEKADEIVSHFLRRLLDLIKQQAE